MIRFASRSFIDAGYLAERIVSSEANRAPSAWRGRRKERRRRPSTRVAERRAGANPSVAAASVEQLAPATVVLAASLAAARDPRGRRHHRVVVETATLGRMRRAPANVEDLERRVGGGLAAGTVHPRQRRGVREVVHDTDVMAKVVPKRK